MNKDELLHELAKKLGLDFQGYEMLVHDVNNLRGAEWLEEVENLGNESLLAGFRELIGCADDDPEEFSGEYDYEEI